MPKFAIVLLLIFGSLHLKAQTWEFGGSLGGSGYMGDLNPSNPVKISGGSAAAYAKRNFNGYFSLKFNYTVGSISAADSNSSSQQFRDRNLSFRTSLREVALIAEFNFMHYIPDAGHNKFTPYIFFGISSVNYNPTANYLGNTYSLRPLRTEGQSKDYAKSAFAFPYGAGIKYNIYGKLTLSADVGYRNPNTDYLDDVSNVYGYKGNSPIGKILSDRSGEKTGNYIGVPGTQRGDFRNRDTYFFAQISLSFTFVTQKCYFEN